MPLCINFADGNTGKGLLYFLSAVIGLVTGICSATSFAIGAVLPQNTCGYIAFGYGISGLLSFGIWMICTKGIWNLTLGNNFLYASCWTIFCIGAFICFLTGILLIVILRKDAIKNSLKNVITVKNNNNNNNNIDAGVITEYSETINNNSNKNDSTDDVYHDKRSSFCCHSTNEEDLLSRNWKAIVYDCRYELFNIFFTMWLTLFIFPVIGPFNWNGVNLSQKDILTGIFQIGDFFGRYLPNLTILRAKTKLLLVLVISRIIFIPLFMLCFKLTNNCFFNALWFQVILMLTFALTNGWFITNSLCNLPNCVIRNKEKGSIGLYASIVILIGIVCGSWMTKLLII